MPYEELQDYLVTNLKIYIDKTTNKISYLALTDNTNVYAALKRSPSSGFINPVPQAYSTDDFEIERNGSIYRVTLKERMNADKVERV